MRFFMVSSRDFAAEAPGREANSAGEKQNHGSQNHDSVSHDFVNENRRATAEAFFLAKVFNA
jgi:hypothetical protein